VQRDFRPEPLIGYAILKTKVCARDSGKNAHLRIAEKSRERIIRQAHTSLSCAYFFIVRVARENLTPEDLNLYGESIEIFETDSLEPVKAFLR
jgi:hypothetical protein